MTKQNDEFLDNEPELSYSENFQEENNSDQSLVGFVEEDYYTDQEIINFKQKEKYYQQVVNFYHEEENYNQNIENSKKLCKEDLDQNSEDLYQDSLPSDESDNNPTYLECYSSDSSQDCYNNYANDKEEHRDTYVVLTDNKNGNSHPRFYCEICKLTFRNTEETSEHISQHSTCKECEICNNIMHKNAYSSHMRIHRESYEQRIAKNKAQCKKCGKTVGKSYMKLHMLRHGSQKDKLSKNKQCPICNKLVNYCYFRDHMQRMHHNYNSETSSPTEEKKICPICDRSVRESKLKQHIAGHSNSKHKQYVCDQCGKIFKSSSSAFKIHCLTHTGNLTYKCQFCPYRGLHLGLLKVHVRTHTKDYHYECSVCKKRFITKSNLSQHEKAHRPPEFSCSTCGRKFILKNRLDMHIKTIHMNIRDEKCDICGKKFGTKYGLKAHEKNVHNIRVWPFAYRGRTASYLKAEKLAQNTKPESKL